MNEPNPARTPRGLDLHPVCVRVPNDLYDRLHVRAAREGRSVSNLVVFMLAEAAGQWPVKNLKPNQSSDGELHAH